ncbi:tail fiber domain-containing protein [Spartinivicinus poritis]|uniref:tail fiber domain-containing protein n=1 Tax=Spartinivicinus poritis TaxID=2994640 RepID=UPI003CC916CC
MVVDCKRDRHRICIWEYARGVWSDNSLKKNLSPLNNSLKKIERLKGISFEWKSDIDGKKDISVIAQDVEKEFPELVNNIIACLSWQALILCKLSISLTPSLCLSSFERLLFAKLCIHVLFTNDH